MANWKPLHVSYTYQGNDISEEVHLTVDLESNQIAVLPTAGILLARQPRGNCNLETLRQEAREKIVSFGRQK